jgi:cytoskeletal protein RodZ
MSKKNHKKRNLTLLGIISIVIILLIWFVVIYNQNSKIIKNYSDNPNLPKQHSVELSKLIQLQQKKGLAEILKVNCNEIDNNEAKQYCVNETKKVNKILWIQ